VLENQYLQYR